MKNKALFFVLIVLGIVSAVLIGVYFFRQNGPAVDPAENTAQNKTPAVSQGKTEQPQNKLVTDDFSIDLPAGWRQTAPAMGASAMAVNADENINDLAAQRINFQSYLAVSYDTLQGKSMSAYLQTVKSGLQQAISSVVFTKDQDMTINGRSAHAIEAELTQQGVNFKILMAVVGGQGEDVWVISFNTTESSWDGYKEMFYSIAGSFSLKE